MRFFAALVVFLATLLAVPAQAQIGFGFGIGANPFGRQLENIRIGAVARGHIEAHLKAEYERLCKAKTKGKGKEKDKSSGSCAEQRPYYKNSFLPDRGDPLPADLLQKIGFVHPGTDYRQIGFSVYLVRLPDRRIHDVVSIWSDGWN